MSDLLPMCPNCGHEIDYHGAVYCWGCFCARDGSDETAFCELRPSDIARALLTAEPTDADPRKDIR